MRDALESFLRPSGCLNVPGVVGRGRACEGDGDRPAVGELEPGMNGTDTREMSQTALMGGRRRV